MGSPKWHVSAVTARIAGVTTAGCDYAARCWGPDMSVGGSNLGDCSRASGATRARTTARTDRARVVSFERELRPVQNVSLATANKHGAYEAD